MEQNISKKEKWEQCKEKLEKYISSSKMDITFGRASGQIRANDPYINGGLEVMDCIEKILKEYE